MLFLPCRGRKIYEPPRYMSVNQAAEQLLAIIQNRRLQGEKPGMIGLFLSATTPLQSHLLMSLWTPLPSPDSQNSALHWIWAPNPSHEMDLAKLEPSTVQWAAVKLHWWLLELQPKPQSGNPALFLSMWNCELFEPLALQEAKGFCILDQSSFKKISAVLLRLVTLCSVWTPAGI